ncbi:MAG: hypothetical protein QXN26_07460 [Thermoplasmataceae archaeon]
MSSNLFSNKIQTVTIPLQSGPHSYTINVQGYGFVLFECDDQSSVIQFDSPNNTMIPLVGISQLVFPDQFNQIIVTNYEPVTTNDLIISFGVIQDPSVQISSISQYRDLSAALTDAQLMILQASQSTTRYYLWQVNAAYTTPSVYTDQNQIYWPNIPLIQQIQPLSLVTGVEFTISTTALVDMNSVTPVLQQPIPSTYIPNGTIMKIMGYSVVYTPVTTGSGTQVFLLNIQQVLSYYQLKAFYALNS